MFLRNLTDWQTKEATAFYAALAVCLWDVWKTGCGLYNTSALIALAGIGTISLVAHAVNQSPGEGGRGGQGGTGGSGYPGGPGGQGGAGGPGK